MKRTLITLFTGLLLLAGSRAGAQFVTPLDSEAHDSVASWGNLVNEAKDSLTSWANEVNAATDSLASWANEVNAATDSLASWANEVNAATDSIAGWTSLVNEAKDSLTSWANEVNAATDSLTSWANEVNAATDSLASWANEVNAATDSLADWTSLINEAKDSLTSWANEVNIATDSLASWANKVNTALQLAGGTMTGNITMPDDGWIGLGADKIKIEFLDETVDTVRIWGYFRSHIGYFTTLTATSAIYSGNGLIVSEGSVALPNDQIDAPEINWGLTSSEVSATDMPDFGTMTATDDNILVADGTDFESVAMTGDVTTNNGTMAITAQAIVGDDIDSTSEDFVFQDAYRGTSGEADSLLLTHGGASATYGGAKDSVDAWGNLVNEAKDSLTSWANEVNAATDSLASWANKVNDILPLSKSFVIQDPAETHDFPFWMTPAAITITACNGVCIDGTNVVGCLMEYDNDAANPVVCNSSDWTFTTGEERTTDLSNASIDAGDYLGWKTTSVSGEVSFLTITIEYTQP